MKRVLFLALLFSAVAIISQSCKKEEDTKVSEEKQIKHGLMLSGEIPIEDRIIQFLDDIEHPGQGVSMDLEDAVWNLEASLNYRYSNAYCFEYNSIVSGDTSDFFSYDSLGLIDFITIKTIYDDFVVILKQENDNISTQIKELLIVDIDSKGNKITMNYKFGVNKAVLSTSPQFNNTDYWYYGGLLGKCGSSQGQYVGQSDAAVEQDKMLRYQRSLYTNVPNGMRVISTAVETEIRVAGMNPSTLNLQDPTPQDNYYDYLLAHGYNNWPNFHICLSPTEMNFYNNGAWSIINSIQVMYPNKDLIFTKISEGHLGTSSQPSQFSHGLEVKYAEISWTNTLLSDL